MKVTDLFRKYRESINSSYTRKNLIIVFITLVILLTIPITVIALKTSSGLSGKAETSAQWGEIVNSSHNNQKIKSTLVFTGKPNPTSTPYYTRYPLNFGQLDWSDDNDVRYAFDLIKNMGLNTIKMSHWSSDGSLCGETLPINDENSCGEILSPVERIEQIDQVFRIAEERNLLVAPFLEVSWPPPGWVYTPGATPQYFPFYSEFPFDLRNIEERIQWLMDNFKDQSNWLEVYDQNGQARKVIWLIETIHCGSPCTQPTPENFAQAFEIVAAEIRSRTGEDIGFIIDPTPLPLKGSYAGPNPDILKTKSSTLAANPFNLVDVASDFNLNQCLPVATQACEEEFIRKSREILTMWKNSGVPLIVPIMPGYDDHLVPGRSGGIRYGENDWWRQEQAKLVADFQTAGISIDTWNGYTEGYVVVPTGEYGYTDYNWARQATSCVENVLDTDGDSLTDCQELIEGTDPNDPNDPRRGDFNGDGRVDMLDFGKLVHFWGTSEPSCDVAPPGGDGIVDIQDFGALAANWEG